MRAADASWPRMLRAQGFQGAFKGVYKVSFNGIYKGIWDLQGIFQGSRPNTSGMKCSSVWIPSWLEILCLAGNVYYRGLNYSNGVLGPINTYGTPQHSIGNYLGPCVNHLKGLLQ